MAVSNKPSPRDDEAPPLVVLVRACDRRAGDWARRDRQRSGASSRALRPRRGQGSMRHVADARNEFVLHAPPDRVAAIAARRGLTVIRRLDPNRGIFLVSGPSRFGSRFDRIRDDDSQDFKRWSTTSRAMPMSPSSKSIPSSSLRKLPPASTWPDRRSTIEAALSDRSLVDYFGGPVWNGYVNQAAVAAIRLPAIQCRRADGRRDCRDHRHRRRSAPPAARRLTRPGL